MEAIILAGGFGKRLRSVVSDVPKPMAPMDDKGTPFLKLLIDTLIKQGVNHIILSTGYKSEIIETYFGSQYKDIEISYSVEDKPLLTGGAIKKALSYCREDNVFVLNGDTFFDVDLNGMLLQHNNYKSKLTIAVKKMENFSRYGTIQFSTEDKIEAFTEKRECEIGWINGGIYCMHIRLLDDMHKQVFSYEKDFLEEYYKEISFYVYKSDGYFVDIGVPEDYVKAQKYYQNIAQL